MQLMFKLDKVLIIFLSPILFYVKSTSLSQTLRQDEASFFTVFITETAGQTCSLKKAFLEIL